MEGPTQKQASESVEKLKPKSLTTAKGSIYTYLPDGRTQRYKKATETLEAPQDLLVFIPPFEKVIDKARELYPNFFTNIENDTQFQQLLLEYMTKDGTKTIRPGADQQEIYSLIGTPRDLQVFLYFIDKIKNKVDFILPTSREAKIGYNTFDARKFYDEGAKQHMRERHIGNKVVSIEYEQ
jgi:hypothetical protein